MGELTLGVGSGARYLTTHLLPIEERSSVLDDPELSWLQSPELRRSHGL